MRGSEDSRMQRPQKQNCCNTVLLTGTAPSWQVVLLVRVQDHYSTVLYPLCDPDGWLTLGCRDKLYLARVVQSFEPGPFVFGPGREGEHAARTEQCTVLVLHGCECSHTELYGCTVMLQRAMNVRVLYELYDYCTGLVLRTIQSEAPLTGVRGALQYRKSSRSRYTTLCFQTSSELQVYNTSAVDLDSSHCRRLAIIGENVLKVLFFCLYETKRVCTSPHVINTRKENERCICRHQHQCKGSD